MDYKKLIETGFDIIDKDGTRKPFVLKPVQSDYLSILQKDYPTMQGVRENVLKARQEGFSALIDAIFTVDFLTQQNIGAQIISHKDEETKLLMNRVNFYVESFCEKNGIDRRHLLKTDSKDYLENKVNGSYIFIGTAGAKTLGRGGTLQNIHWSEVGFYPNTAIMNAERLVSGAEQQVAMGIGKIFRESTGNMFGDYYHGEIERSRKNDSAFKFRFFAWFEDPQYQLEQEDFDPSEEERAMMLRYNLTPWQIAWYRAKMSEFKTKALGLREYPSNPEEAFLSGGDAFFDVDVTKKMYDNIREPLKVGNLAADGGWM